VNCHDTSGRDKIDSLNGQVHIRAAHAVTQRDEAHKTAQRAAAHREQQQLVLLLLQSGSTNHTHARAHTHTHTHAHMHTHIHTHARTRMHTDRTLFLDRCSAAGVLRSGTVSDQRMWQRWKGRGSVERLGPVLPRSTLSRAATMEIFVRTSFVRFAALTYA
jgi:hypothetical protein